MMLTELTGADLFNAAYAYDECEGICPINDIVNRFQIVIKSSLLRLEI